MDSKKCSYAKLENDILIVNWRHGLKYQLRINRIHTVKFSAKESCLNFYGYEVNKVYLESWKSFPNHFLPLLRDIMNICIEKKLNFCSDSFSVIYGENQDVEIL